MTKKYKFNFYNGLLTMNGNSEIVELDEHLDENEIYLEFGKWFFDQLDTSGISGSWNEVTDE